MFQAIKNFGVRAVTTNAPLNSGIVGAKAAITNNALKSGFKKMPVYSNTKSSLNSVLQTAAKYDADTGGHLGRMFSSKPLKGLVPSASEFKPIKRTIPDSINRSELADYVVGKAQKAAQIQDVSRMSSGIVKYNGVEVDLSKVGKKTKSVIDYAAGGAGKSYMDSLDSIEKGYIMQEQNMLQKAQTYFSNAEYGRKRMLAGGLVAGGMAIHNRYSQGGTLTRDRYGDFDIAGVPFI